ncbi:DNA polymerase Y family protein [Desulfogranum mediterraneum]|uniref:DNA polymerase Y family protein n=1 Tax=Desulfogranum mediterraneum TaxID=160661 RepID=UPI0004101094|nr:hypothetical protein [Desulfogranum mediterraneum]
MERSVIHLNIADFSVAVERLLDSSLRSQPLIIAQPAARSVVYDMSEEAYQDGVRKGMMLGQARRRCRRAAILPPRPEKYCQLLGHCLGHARRFSPLVEPAAGQGHLYLDVTGTHRLFGPPPDIGWRLRKTLQAELGLDPIWSLAPNKLIAKVASRLVKPVGEYIVASGEEEAFLAPLPLELIPGLNGLDLERLAQLQIRRVNQATPLSVSELAVLCGKRARPVFQAIRGIDHQPVTSASRDRLQRLEHCFTPDTNQEALVRAAVAELAAQLGFQLRRRRQGCRKLSLSLLYSDGVECIRQAACRQPLSDDPPLEELALTALYRAWHRRVRLRRLQLSWTGHHTPGRQLSLLSLSPQTRPERGASLPLQGLSQSRSAAPQAAAPTPIPASTPRMVPPERSRKLSQACDLIQERYGPELLRRGSRFQAIQPGQGANSPKTQEART